MLCTGSIFSQTIHYKEILQAPGREEPISIIPAAGGGFYLYGYTKSSGFGLYDLYIIRTNADGQQLWWKNYGSYMEELTSSSFTIWGIPGFTLLQQDDNNLLASFSYEDTTLLPGSAHTAILKLDSSGNILSQHPYKFSGSSASAQIIKSRFIPNEYFMLVDDYGGNDRPVVAKINAAGDIIAAYNPPNGLWKHPVSFAQTTDKGFIISGTQEYGADYCWLIKTDSIGNRQWAVAVDSGYIFQSYGSTVVETAGGNYLLTIFYSGMPNGEAIIKLDHSGNKIWAKNIVSLTTDTISSGRFYEINSNKYAVVCAKKVTGINEYKTVIAIMDSSGNIQSGKFLDFGNNNSPHALCFTPNNEIGFIGYWNPGTSSDILFGLTNMNSSNECFESTYNLQSVNKAIGVYIDNQFITGQPITSTTGPIDSLLVSSGWPDSVLCTTALAVENIKDDMLHLSAYPNPADQYAVISFLPGAGNQQPVLDKAVIRIFDVMGKEIYLYPSAYSNQMVQTSNLSDGIYFVQLQTGSKTANLKLMVLH